MCWPFLSKRIYGFKNQNQFLEGVEKEKIILLLVILMTTILILVIKAVMNRIA